VSYGCSCPRHRSPSCGPRRTIAWSRWRPAGERAFEAIAERYQRSLLRHARRYRPETRAEDALKVGAAVEEAELKISSAGRVWDEIELR
jgi:hypothetical protein